MPTRNEVDFAWHMINGRMVCFDLQETLNWLDHEDQKKRFNAFNLWVSRTTLEHRLNGGSGMWLFRLESDTDEVEMTDEEWFDTYGVRYRPRDPVGDQLMNEPVGSWDEEDNFIV